VPDARPLPHPTDADKEYPQRMEDEKENVEELEHEGTDAIHLPDSNGAMWKLAKA
jgi:hypothetical protein